MATLASPAGGLLRGARRRESLPCGRLECLESASALKSKKSLDCRSPLAGDPSFSPRSISMATIASPASGLLRVRGGANRFRAEGWNVSNRLAPSSPKNHSIVGARLRAIRRSAPDLSEWPPSLRPQAGSCGVRGGANRFRAKGWNVSNWLALTPKTPLDCRSPLAGDPSFGPPDPSEWPPSLRPQAGSYGGRGGANRYRAEGWNARIGSRPQAQNTTRL